MADFSPKRLCTVHTKHDHFTRFFFFPPPLSLLSFQGIYLKMFLMPAFNTFIMLGRWAREAEHICEEPDWRRRRGGGALHALFMRLGQE